MCTAFAIVLSFFSVRVFHGDRQIRSLACANIAPNKVKDPAFRLIPGNFQTDSGRAGIPSGRKPY
jgi:hypothetical protein